jgi:hypothetical protein
VVEYRCACFSGTGRGTGRGTKRRPLLEGGTFNGRSVSQGSLCREKHACRVSFPFPFPFPFPTTQPDTGVGFGLGFGFGFGIGLGFALAIVLSSNVYVDLLLMGTPNPGRDILYEESCRVKTKAPSGSRLA